jgi:hypothetical protein
LAFQKNQMRDTRFPAFVYDKQHDFKIQNSVNRTPVIIFLMNKKSNQVYVFGGAGFLGKAFRRACPEAVPCDSADRLARAGMRGVEFDFGVDQPEGLPCGEGDLAVVFSWRGYPAAQIELRK